MSDVAIRVESISKYYRIGERDPYRMLRDVLVRFVSTQARRIGSRLVGGSSENDGDQNQNDFWALRDVSFEVREGEALGIIGRNGAGKSTLLKILSRITLPTRGRAQMYGRLASLLEVGTGFHPELTGRDNIYLNGAILGMRRTEIERKFDEIVSFAEVERFIDTPVKHYSSGMYLRLAFAVAAHLEPEILLVDEVLAVGDVAFQKKCLGKMDDVAKQGRTILFVSHNLQAIAQLTHRSDRDSQLDLLPDTDQHSAQPFGLGCRPDFYTSRVASLGRSDSL
jgi:homopolymeric O-antigen transport system ATP-binding protein